MMDGGRRRRRSERPSSSSNIIPQLSILRFFSMTQISEDVVFLGESKQMIDGDCTSYFLIALLTLARSLTHMFTRDWEGKRDGLIEFSSQKKQLAKNAKSSINEKFVRILCNMYVLVQKESLLYALGFYHLLIIRASFKASSHSRQERSFVVWLSQAKKISLHTKETT